VKKVFADTSYWIALLNKNDQYHASALAIDSKLQDIEIITSDLVLAEVLNSFSSKGSFMRKLIAKYVNHLLNAKGYSIIEQSRDQFINALRIYSRYADKDWGFVDCVSYCIMRDHHLTEVLTHDRHFRQMGFNTLLELIE
jgi:uncharacterized protein